MIMAFVAGVIIVVVDRVFPKVKPYTPSPAALGIALTIPAYTSFAMFLGAFIVWILERKAPSGMRATPFPSPPAASRVRASWASCWRHSSPLESSSDSIELSPAFTRSWDNEAFTNHQPHIPDLQAHFDAGFTGYEGYLPPSANYQNEPRAMVLTDSTDEKEKSPLNAEDPRSRPVLWG